MKAAASVTGAVYAEQVDTTCRQLPIAVVVNLVNAALTAIVLRAPRVMAASATLVRIGNARDGRPFRAVVAVSTHLDFTRKRSSMVPAGVCGSALAGLSWGIGGAVILGGPCTRKDLSDNCDWRHAGAVVLSAAHLPTLLCVLASGDTAHGSPFFTEGTTPDTALGTTIVVFVGALALAGKRFSDTFAETMRLRFELNEANLRLRAEIAEHRTTEGIAPGPNSKRWSADWRYRPRLQ